MSVKTLGKFTTTKAYLEVKSVSLNEQWKDVDHV